MAVPAYGAGPTPTRTAAPFRPSRPAAYVAALVAVTALYVAAGKLGLSLASINASASPVWPPTGLAIAAVLLLGARILPAIGVGAFLVNVTTTGHVASSLSIAAGNTLEAALAGILMLALTRGRVPFSRASDVFTFALVAGLFASAIAASVGTASLVASGLATSADAATVWTTWWLGDAVGALILAPPLVLVAQSGRPRYRLGEALEVVALLTAAAFLAVAIFGPLWGKEPIPLAFLSLPAIVWAAYRLHPREAALVTLTIAVVATVGTVLGHGPFQQPQVNMSLLILQAFLAVSVLLALPLSIVVQERRGALAAVAEARDRLEERVAARTHDLEVLHERFRRFTQDLPGYAWIKDAEGRYVYCNDAFAATVGRKPDGIVGRTDDQIFDAATAAEYRVNDAQVRTTGKPLRTVEPQLVGGVRRHSLVSKFPLLAPGTAAGLIGGIAFDVTERIEAESALRRSQARLAEAQRVARMGSFEWDVEADRLTWSDELCRIYGVDPAEAPGDLRGFLSFVHPSERDAVQGAVDRLLDAPGAFSFDERIVRADGEVRILATEGEYRPAGDDKGARLVGNCRDVTDLRQAEEGARDHFVTRRLVRRLLRDARGASPGHRRELGRALVEEIEVETLPAHLRAFDSMGVGRLSFASESSGRYTFHGDELLERTPGLGRATCFIALGFLEAAVWRITGERTLGTETTCQSMGHASCTFVIQAKLSRPSPP